jgi:hypothetical protein
MLERTQIKFNKTNLIKNNVSIQFNIKEQIQKEILTERLHL